MSVKHSLLAVLVDGERYGYQLRAEFEERTGATWPLNIGQVYTTLSRLERDGLVAAAGEDVQGHVFYRITDAGREELVTWFARPVVRAERPRDELAVKLALAVTVEGIDVTGIVHAQRKHALGALQDYTRVKARLTPEELAASLVVESMIFQCEAEIRWLNHVEARVTRHSKNADQARNVKQARNANQTRNPKQAQNVNQTKQPNHGPTEARPSTEKATREGTAR
jgi:DNA-binding PadR family transcriptional regulator